MKALLKLFVILFVAQACVVALAEEKAPAVGDQIIDFKAKDLDGKELNTADLRKEKVLILKFGASWCGWCNRQSPVLTKIQKEYADKVVVIDVASKEPLAPEKYKEHKAKNGGEGYVTLLDTNAAELGKYQVRGIPLVLVADKNGKITFKSAYTDYEKLKAEVEKALKN